MSAATTTRRRTPRGYGIWEEGAITYRTCPDCTPIDFRHADDPDELQDEFGNDLVILKAPFNCEECGDDC